MLPCVNAEHGGAHKSLHLCLYHHDCPLLLLCMQLQNMEHEYESRVAHHSGAFGAHVSAPPYVTKTWKYKADEHGVSLVMRTLIQSWEGVTMIGILITWKGSSALHIFALLYYYPNQLVARTAHLKYCIFMRFHLTGFLPNRQYNEDSCFQPVQQHQVGNYNTFASVSNPHNILKADFSHLRCFFDNVVTMEGSGVYADVSFRVDILGGARKGWFGCCSSPKTSHSIHLVPPRNVCCLFRVKKSQNVAEIHSACSILDPTMWAVKRGEFAPLVDGAVCYLHPLAQSCSRSFLWISYALCFFTPLR